MKKFLTILTIWMTVFGVTLNQGEANAQARASADLCRAVVSRRVANSRIPRVYHRSAINAGTHLARQLSKGNISYSSAWSSVYTRINRVLNNPGWSRTLTREVMSEVYAASQTRACN